MIKFDSVEGFAVYAMQFCHMMRQEQERKLKHLNNPRCKREDYGGIACYLQEKDANISTKDIEEIANQYIF